MSDPTPTPTPTTSTPTPTDDTKTETPTPTHETPISLCIPTESTSPTSPLPSSSPSSSITPSPTSSISDVESNHKIEKKQVTRERRKTFEHCPVLIPSDIDALLAQEHLHKTESSSWRILVTQSNVACWAKEYGKTGFDAVRAVAYIKGHTLETVTKLIYDLDINRKWNLFWEIQEDLGEIDEMNGCIYVLSKIPFMGIARREFVQFRHQTYIDQGKTSVVLYRNGAHPSKKEKPGAVRGQSLGITGYIMRTVDKMEPFDTAANKKEIITEDDTEDDPALLAAAASADDVPVLSPDDEEDTKTSTKSTTGAKAKAVATNVMNGAASLGAAAFSKLSLWGRAAANKAVGAPASPPPEPTSFTANGITIDYVNGGLVKITYITAIDPKGYIPKRAFNFIMSKGPVRWAKTLQAACDTYVCNGGKM